MNMTNLTDQQLEDNREFLVGDVVVIKDHVLGPYLSDSIFHIIEYKEDFLGGHVQMQDSSGKIWTSGCQHPRLAEPIEIKFCRRLTEAEIALTEVP
ncbi:hypothetical protein IAE20_03585 [Acinetobacter sp. S54]|nr:hypothetical protein [Acinetobacter sp. S55]MBK0065978.1 hypothetical protein [Acinetobacter sp. S54]